MVSMNTPDEGCRAQSQRIARTFPNPYRDPSRATERTQPLIVTIPELGYELRPYGKGPCWQLYELATDRRSREGQTLPDAWLPRESYPSTLEHGLRLILERAARHSKAAGDLEAALAEIRCIGDALTSACGGLHLPQRGDSAGVVAKCPAEHGGRPATLLRVPSTCKIKTA